MKPILIIKPFFLILILLIANSNNTYSQKAASLLSPIGNTLGITDQDDSSEEVSLTSVFPLGINFGGTTYTSMFVCTNGFVTFSSGAYTAYDPEGIAGFNQGYPIISAQQDDIDLGTSSPNHGELYYYQNVAENYVVVTWYEAGPYSTPVGWGSETNYNTFQIVLRKSAGYSSTNLDFQIEIRYINIGWHQSHNVAPSWPTAGWSTGNQTSYGETPYSGQSYFQNSASGSGIQQWTVTGGAPLASPTVNETTSATSITRNSALSGGNISSNGGASISQHGIVWSTSSMPTTGSYPGGNLTTFGATTTGSFTSNITGLAQSTTYYVRAYATNNEGTAYGPQMTFTTFPTAPTVDQTAFATNVTTNSARSGGNISADGDESIIQHGVVWSTSYNPTLGIHPNGNFTEEGSVASVPHNFTSDLSGLSMSTGYYVCSYATNSVGTAYGPNIYFSTPSNTPPTVNNENYFVYARTSRSVSSPTLLANDSDTDGDVISITNTGTNATSLGGSVTLASNGTFTYTAPTNQNAGANDTFSYTVSDGLASTTGTCTINLIDAIFIGTNPNTTAGNWNGNYVPPLDADMDVVFQSGTVTISSSMIIRNLTIYNAASFNCTGGATITVNGNIGNETRMGINTNSPIILSSGIKIHD